MRIYLDSCCYNRPFDDQTQERIHLESETILTILNRGRTGAYEIIGSSILELEIDRIQDAVRKKRVKDLYEATNAYISYTEDIKKRSREIMEYSKIRTFDSLHIAAAEASGAYAMLTTDDKLEKSQSHEPIKIRLGGDLMLNVDLNNPMEIRAVGIQALKDALGPVGMVRFIQQYDLGYGDYTKERLAEPDISLEEVDRLLKIE